MDGKDVSYPVSSVTGFISIRISAMPLIWICVNRLLVLCKIWEQQNGAFLREATVSGQTVTTAHTDIIVKFIELVKYVFYKYVCTEFFLHPQKCVVY